jgi:cyclohexa-1,5-dienecarbonyl-CoA hydratase
MDYKNLILRELHNSLIITINKPPVNILDIATMREITSALTELKSRGDVTAVVLRGYGHKSFSAGVDIKDHTLDKIPAMLEVFHGIFRLLREIPQISVAAVQGLCLGGGCELAIACDFLIVTSDAKLMQPEIDVGCYPPVAAALAPKLIGLKRAAPFIYLGQPLSGRDALDLGLASQLVEPDALDGAVEELLIKLNSKSRAVLRLARRALYAGAENNYLEALQKAEEIYLNELSKTADCAEGIEAFLNKRKPAWRHR